MIHLFIAACYTPWLLLRFHSPFAENICKAVSSFLRIVKVSSEKYFQVWICALVCMIAQNMPINLRIAQNESFVIGSYLMLGVMPGTFLCAFAVSQNSSIFLMPNLFKIHRLTLMACCQLPRVASYTLLDSFSTFWKAIVPLHMRSGTFSSIPVCFCFPK